MNKLKGLYSDIGGDFEPRLYGAECTDAGFSRALDNCYYDLSHSRKTAAPVISRPNEERTKTFINNQTNL